MPVGPVVHVKQQYGWLRPLPILTFPLSGWKWNKWFRYSVKDEELALGSQNMDRQGLSGNRSRESIFNTILYVILRRPDPVYGRQAIL